MSRRRWYSYFVVAPIIIVIGTIYPALIPDDLEWRITIVRIGLEVAVIVFLCGMVLDARQRLGRQDHQLMLMQAENADLRARYDALVASGQALAVIPATRKARPTHLSAVERNERT